MQQNTQQKRDMGTNSIMTPNAQLRCEARDHDTQFDDRKH